MRGARGKHTCNYKNVVSRCPNIYLISENTYQQLWCLSTILKLYFLVRGAFNKFPDFFGMDTFINRTHKKL